MPFLQLSAHGLLTAGDKAAVDAVLFHQRVVCAALDDLPPVRHKDLVGMPDSFQPVGDHNDSFLLCQLADYLQSLCGAVQKEHGDPTHRIPEDRKGENAVTEVACGG